MNFETFFDKVEQSDLSIKVEHISCPTQSLGNDALFQIPLISLIVLVLAKDRRKPLVSEIGQIVGESIEVSMTAFKGSAQHLGWSANLRVRTVKALGFLEHAQLVEVDSRQAVIKATVLGRKVIDRALKNDDNLSYNLALITRSYRNICVSKQLVMELE